MKKAVSILLVVALLSISTSAFAYNYWVNKAKLNGGPKGQEYYTSDEFFDGRYYGGFVRNAVSDWNKSVIAYPADMTEVAFTESDSRSNTVVDFMIDNYGSTGWNGVADFFQYGVGQINEDGFGPEANYDWSRISLNDTYLNDDDSDDITATAKHEFGHSLGLAHSDTKDAIMYKNRDRNTINVESDDVNGVKKLY